MRLSIKRFNIFRNLAQSIMVAIMIFTPFTALAVSQETRTAIDNDAPFYDSRSTCTNQVSVSTNLNGNDNLEKAFRFFVGQGLTAEQSAAIVGNLQQESGVNPTSHQDGGGAGRGIAQWSVSGRWPGVVEYAKSQNKSEWDLGVQLEYIWRELHAAYAPALAALIASQGIPNMTTNFELKYEAAGKPEMAKRIAYAQKVFQLYGGDVSSAPPTQTSSVSSGAVYMMGDSITVGIDGAGVSNSLKAAGYQPTTINGVVGRSAPEGLTAIDKDRGTVASAKVIFVGLGTNPGGTVNQTTWGSQIDQIIDKIRGINTSAPVYWLNVISPAIKDASARNNTLNQHSSSKKFTVIDAAGANLGLQFGSDGLHPTNYQPLSDFVVKSMTGNASSSSTSSSSCSDAVGNGQDTKYIDGFTVYSQNDPAWKNSPYGSTTVGLAGCGPSAMAMIVTALTGQSVTPPEVATYAKSMFREGEGSSWMIAPFIADHYKLSAELIGADVGKITAALLAGKLVAAPGDGPKPYTSGGHYIVIRGVTASGKWKVGDSGHSDTSDKEWDPQQLVQSMHGGGVYAISK